MESKLKLASVGSKVQKEEPQTWLNKWVPAAATAAATAVAEAAVAAASPAVALRSGRNESGLRIVARAPKLKSKLIVEAAEVLISLR